MQEQLKLLQIPNVDTSRLSTVGEFRRFVREIERRWNINLEFNDNARWRPGSYERLKGQVTNALFPHWSKPKGANTIRRLTRSSHYSCNQLSNDLIAIDDKLKTFRTNKQTLDEKLAAEEGQELLTEFVTELTRPIDGVTIEITPLPYFARVRRSNNRGPDEIYESSWDNPLHPAYDCDGRLLMYNISANEVQEKYRVYNFNTNPKRWFINISIPLNDIVLEYKSRNTDDEIRATTPYGSLVVCFTVPLYDAVMNYRIIKNCQGLTEGQMENKLHTRYYSNHTFTYPFVNSIQHPFVHSGNRRYSYQWGNTCFGDYRAQVSMALSTGMMGHLKGILKDWCKTYYLDGTSPLNQVEYHHLGLPNEWSQWVAERVNTNPELCSSAVRNGMDIEILMDNHCNNCQLRASRCNYWSSLTREPIEMPSSVKAELNSFTDSLPGVPLHYPVIQAKSIILTMCEKLWNICSVHSDDYVVSTLRLFCVADMGNGNMKWETFTGFINNLQRDMMAPEEEMDIEQLARRMYKIFRYCERIYWEYSIGYDEELWETVGETMFHNLSSAETDLPVADYRMMVNTHRAQQNMEPYEEYLDMLNRVHLTNFTTSEEGDNNGPF